MQADNIATNATRIALEIDRSLIQPMGVVSEIVAAATALDLIESKKGFAWEDQQTDWESVCAALAKVITQGLFVKNAAGWAKVVRKAINGRL